MQGHSLWGRGISWRDSQEQENTLHMQTYIDAEGISEEESVVWRMLAQWIWQPAVLLEEVH